MIEKMRIEHVEEVAKIHAASWDVNEISAKLGEGFLRRFYKSVVTSPLAFGYVYVEGDKIAACTGGLYKYKEFNRSLLKRNIFYLSGLIMKRIFSGKIKAYDLFIMLGDSKKLRNLRFPDYHWGFLSLSNQYKKTAKGKMIYRTLIEKVLQDFKDNGCGGCWGPCDDRNKAMEKILLNFGFCQVDTIRYPSRTTIVFEKIF